MGFAWILASACFFGGGSLAVFAWILVEEKVTGNILVPQGLEWF